MTYDDLREQKQARKLYLDAKAEEKAVSIINAQAMQAEKQAVIKAEQAQAMGNTAQIEDIIAQMESLHQSGQDPMELLEQLPEELKMQVEEALQHHASQQEEGSDEESTMPQEAPPQGGMGMGMGMGRGRGMGRGMSPEAQQVAMQRANDPQNPITAQAQSLVQGL